MLELSNFKFSPWGWGTWADFYEYLLFKFSPWGWITRADSIWLVHTIFTSTYEYTSIYTQGSIASHKHQTISNHGSLWHFEFPLQPKHVFATLLIGATCSFVWTFGTAMAHIASNHNICDEYTLCNNISDEKCMCVFLFEKDRNGFERVHDLLFWARASSCPRVSNFRHVTHAFSRPHDYLWIFFVDYVAPLNLFNLLNESSLWFCLEHEASARALFKVKLCEVWHFFIFHNGSSRNLIDHRSRASTT